MICFVGFTIFVAFDDLLGDFISAEFHFVKRKTVQNVTKDMRLQVQFTQKKRSSCTSKNQMASPCFHDTVLSYPGSKQLLRRFGVFLRGSFQKVFLEP